MLDSFAEEFAVELKGTLESLEARSLSRSGPRIYINRPPINNLYEITSPTTLSTVPKHSGEDLG